LFGNALPDKSRSPIFNLVVTHEPLSSGSFKSKIVNTLDAPGLRPGAPEGLGYELQTTTGFSA
jgi:hypothetical protein